MKELKEDYALREAYHLYGEEPLIKWIERIMDNLPNEYKDSAKICFSCGRDYDSTTACISVVYTRPETDEEEFIRESIEEKARDIIKRRDLETLEELKKKYEA